VRFTTPVRLRINQSSRGSGAIRLIGIGAAGQQPRIDAEPISEKGWVR
jgi:hypothetical protein